MKNAALDILVLGIINIVSTILFVAAACIQHDAAVAQLTLNLMFGTMMLIILRWAVAVVTEWRNHKKTGTEASLKD